MIITNKYNLPGPLVAAIRNDTYKSGGAAFSTTTLLKPAYQRRLMIKHAGDITEDASDRIWALLGQAKHEVLQRAASGDNNCIAEKRYYGLFPVKGANISVSGQIDLYEIKEKRLIDYKETSIWKLKNALSGKGLEEWEAQLNINRYLMLLDGLHVPEKLFIMGIGRDWNKSKAKFDSTYPPRVAMIPVQVWNNLDTLKYIESRLEQHMSENPEPCSPTERWQRETVYAVKKKKNKKATKLFTSESDAKKFIANAGKDFEIEYRPGGYNRCEEYCAVSSFCEIYKKEKENEE